MTGARTTGVGQTVDFDGLTIRFDDRVLRPRPWTVAQAHWAADLVPGLPPGPVVELCAGAAHIGLVAVLRSQRRLVCVDADEVAAGFAADNARAAGLAARVEVRQALVTEALAAGEEFALVIADPPWVRRRHTGSFPEDPVRAIDGGPDGLQVARQCVEVIGAHLRGSGAALLQLGSADQAESLGPELDHAGLTTVEVRRYDGGVVALLEHRR